MGAGDSDGTTAIAARLDELSRVCERLSAENAELRDQVTALASAPARRERRASRPGAAREAGSGAGAVSRRAIGRALGVAAAGVVGAAALADATARPAAAANGDPVIAGRTVNAEDVTEVRFDGNSGPGAVLLANDSPTPSGGIGLSAALVGLAANGNVSSGVHGSTSVSGGDGVVGVSYAAAGSGVHGIAGNGSVVGVLAENPYGTALSATSDSFSDNATAVVATMTNTAAGASSSAVRGVNNATNDQGSGVWGSHASGGYGVYGQSATGIGVFGSGGAGVYGQSDTGTGVVGSSDVANGTGVQGISNVSTGNGAGVQGASYASNGAGVQGIGYYGNNTGVHGISFTGNGTGVAGSGKTGVSGTGSATGVSASGPVAVHGGGSGSNGRGGVFSGAAAQVRLAPGALGTHPVSGSTGDLYVDKTGRLWFCKTGGTTATWHQIA